MQSNKKHTVDISTVWILFVITALAATWSVMYIFTLPQGDDLVYTTILRQADGIGTGVYSVWEFPRYWARHWVFSNGRSANMLASFTMGVLPHWLVSVMCGIATGMMYLLILYFCRLFPSRGKGLAATLAVGVIAFFFPWWDAFSLIDVCYNYVWAVSLPLAVLFLLHRADTPALAAVGRMDSIAAKAKMAGLAILCVLAGMIHEAATLPLCAGMLWMAWVGGSISRSAWRGLSPQRRIMLVAFLAGVAIVVLSPGIIMRALREKTPDDVWWLLLVKSAPVTLLLILAMLLALLRKSSRRALYAMLLSDTGFWAVSAVVSLIFVAIGGIVGRSGWFSQTYALIALWRWWSPEAKYHVGRVGAAVAASVVGLLVVAQMVGVDIYSHRGWEFDKKLREAYAASPDGIVCLDMPDDTDLPFWAFSRVRYLRPEDDYTHYGLRMYYKKEHPLINLPAALAQTDWGTFDSYVALDDAGHKAVEITAECPDGTVFPDDPGWVGWHVGRYETAAGDSTVRKWVIPFEKDGRKLFMLLPFRPHFGDRFN